MNMFEDMTKVLTPGELGSAKLEVYEVNKLHSAISAFQGGINYVPEGKYIKLVAGGTLQMSNTRMEQNSNYEVVRKSRGDVLIAGLGIGLILVPILRKKEVVSVTVIEKDPDVISLVEPQLRKFLGKDADKLKVIQANIFEWKPQKGKKWDVIYFDIWPTICVDNLEEMTKLHRKFAHNKAPEGWMDSWYKNYLRQLKRSGRWR